MNETEELSEMCVFSEKHSKETYLIINKSFFDTFIR